MAEHSELIPPSQNEDKKSQGLTPETFVNASLARYLGTAIAENGGRFIRSRCTLCNASVRMEAEKMYDEKLPITTIKEFLDKNGINISKLNITHHMKEHYKTMERQALLVEYCEDLDGMLAARRSRFEELDLLVNIGRIELLRAASIPTNGTLDGEKTRNEIVVKSHKMMLDSLKTLNDMESGEAKAIAVRSQMINVWKAQIMAAKSPQERDMLIKLLSSFKKECEMLPDPEGDK